MKFNELFLLLFFGNAANFVLSVEFITGNVNDNGFRSFGVMVPVKIDSTMQSMCFEPHLELKCFRMCPQSPDAPFYARKLATAQPSRLYTWVFLIQNPDSLTSISFQFSSNLCTIGQPLLLSPIFATPSTLSIRVPPTQCQGPTPAGSIVLDWREWRFIMDPAVVVTYDAAKLNCESKVGLIGMPKNAELFGLLKAVNGTGEGE